MYKYMNVEKAKWLALGTAINFLLIHVFLFLMFLHHDVVPMVCFNLGSILFYIFILWVVKKGMFRLYVVGMYLEVIAHMSAAVICTGWESGFQTTLIGMSILLFYSEYVSRYLKQPYVPSFPLCILGPAAYIFSYIWIRYHSPQYVLSENASFSLQIFWAVVTFSITIMILYVFVELCLKSEEYLENEVGHDQLTGLPNRYYFSDYLSNLDFSWENGAETGGESDETEEPQDNGLLAETSELNKNWSGYWIAMLDIDDFKNVNDTYGHNCGDFILKEIANILRKWKTQCGVQAEINLLDGTQRMHDTSEMAMTIGRWGGEEFLVLGRGGSNVREMLEMLRKNIQRHEFHYRGEDGSENKIVRVTVTIGQASYKQGMNVREWIGTADSRLYLGKASGKNKVVDRSE